MTPQFLIYGLTDPRTAAVRYVGKSSSGMARPRAHANEAIKNRKVNPHKANWIRSLVASGMAYGIVVLEEVNAKSDLNAAEIRWIAHGRANNWPLTNLTAGGGGANGASVETRQKMSVAKAGRPLTDEWRARIGASIRGSEKFKEAMHRRAGGKHSEEHRAKIAAAGRGRTLSHESCAKGWATRRANGTDTYRNPRRGARHMQWLHSLSTDEIVRLREAGKSYGEIGAALGCSPGTARHRYVTRSL